MTTSYDAIVVGARCAGVADRHAAGPPGATACCWSTGPRSRATPCPPTSSTHRASPRCAAGACSTQVVATGCPPIDTLLVRLRAVHASRGTPRPVDGISTAYAPAPHRARQDPRRRGGRGRRRGAGGLHRRRAARRGRRGRRHPRVTTPTATVDASGPASSIGADGRNSQRRQGRAAPSSTTRSRVLQYAYYTYWQRPARRRLRDRTSGPTAAGRALPTNDGLTLVVVGWPVRRGRRLQGRRRGQLPRRRSSWRPSSPSAVRGATRVERVHRRRGARTSSASRTGRAGRWSATPATTRTRSPRRASPTPSATPSAAPRRSTRRSRGGRPFDDAMAAYQRPATRRAARSTSSRPSWRRSRRRRRSCSSCWPRWTATTRRWTVRQRDRRHLVAGGVLRARQHRPDHGRCLGGLAGVPHSSSVDRSGRRDRGPTSRRGSDSRPRPGTTGPSRLSAARGWL